MGDDDPPKNPFVRWKQHVDTHVAATLNGLLGIPSIMTKNLNIRRSNDQASPAESQKDEPSLPTVVSPAALTPTASASRAPSSATAVDQPYSPPDDNTLDGIDATQLLEWHKFVYYSAYSPLRLQQQQSLRGLPPPVPRDVPFGADPYAFTYADAFEDLLRATSGRPLLDLSTRSYRNLQNLMRHGSAAEPPYVFFHRLHTQRLLDAYFPRVPVTSGAGAGVGALGRTAAVTADTPNDSAIQAAVAEAQAGHEEDFWREKDPETERGENALEGSGVVGRDDFPSHTGQGSLFDELDRVFRVLGRIVDEGTGGAKPTGDDDDNNSEKKKKADSQPRPLTVEDELYQMVRSAYADAEKSLGTLIKTFVGDNDIDTREGTKPSGNDANNNTAVVTTGRADTDYETIQTTDEHVDAFGNRHVKTVVRRLDAAGNEVARETRYTVRSTSAQEAALPQLSANKRDADNGEKDEASSETTAAAAKEQPDISKSGWFWK